MIGKSFIFLIREFCSKNSNKFIIGLNFNKESIYYSKINLYGEIVSRRIISLNLLHNLDEKYHQLKADKCFKELIEKDIKSLVMISLKKMKYLPLTIEIAQKINIPILLSEEYKSVNNIPNYKCDLYNTIPCINMIITNKLGYIFYNYDRNNSLILNKLNITLGEMHSKIKNFFDLLKRDNLYKSLKFYDDVVDESININFIKKENFKNQNKIKTELILKFLDCYDYNKDIYELFNDFNHLIKSNSLKLVSIKEDHFIINNIDNYIYIDKVMNVFENIVYVNSISRYKFIKDINLNILLSIIIQLEMNIITIINQELFSSLKYFRNNNMKINNINIIGDFYKNNNFNKEIHDICTHFNIKCINFFTENDTNDSFAYIGLEYLNSVGIKNLSSHVI